MPYLLLILLLLLLGLIPQWWVRRTLQRYHRQPEENFPGTGGELARHLLDRFELQDVGLEITDQGDHYDPQAKCVRLTEDKFHGRTLTAITVAAHECGHALQHAAREPLFELRTRLAGSAAWATRIGVLLLYAAPLLTLLHRAPSVMALQMIGAFLVMGFGVLIQLMTLPVEIDASFNKALPLLESGYLNERQKRPARQILRAAAFTYVAAAMAALLNLWRWRSLMGR